jgi:DnaJ-class molecular chaperone
MKGGDIMSEAVPCPDCDGEPGDTDDGDCCDTCGGDGWVVDD